MRRRLYAAAFAIHFVAIGAVCCEDTLVLIARKETILPAPSVQWAQSCGQVFGRILGATMVARSYLHLAGSESGYSYFAPNVADSYRLTLEIGQTHSGSDFASDQAIARNNFRFSSLIDRIGEAEPEGLRGLFLQSIAYSAWRRHPEATRIRAILSASDLPDVAEFIQGERLTYRFVCAYDFSIRRTKR